MPDEPETVSAPDSAAPTPQQVQADLRKANDELQSVAADVRDEAMAQADALKQAAQERLGGMADRAKGVAAERKNDLADQLAGVSKAITRAADDLETEQQTKGSAGYVRDLAGGLQRFSDTVRSNDVDRLVEMAQDFGRRQPAAMLGLAALAGFAAGRFLMASSESRTAKATGDYAASDYEDGSQSWSNSGDTEEISDERS